MTSPGPTVGWHAFYRRDQRDHRDLEAGPTAKRADAGIAGGAVKDGRFTRFQLAHQLQDRLTTSLRQPSRAPAPAHRSPQASSARA